MSLVNLPVPALHNGVSQQSPVVRSPDQAERQVNGWSSLAHGLTKRPPLHMMRSLMGSVSPTAVVHHINRDADERYIVVADGGQLRVFDLQGNEKVVHAPNGWGYLASASEPGKDLAFTTVADYTFVVNKKVTPAMVPLPEPTPGNPNPPPPEQTPPPDYYVPPHDAGWGRDNYWIM